jgi:hypothetical protein
LSNPANKPDPYTAHVSFGIAFLILADEFLPWKLLVIAVCTVLLLLLARALSSSESINTSAMVTNRPLFLTQVFRAS